jgi:hypothetical protein
MTVRLSLYALARLEARLAAGVAAEQPVVVPELALFVHFIPPPLRARDKPDLAWISIQHVQRVWMPRGPTRQLHERHRLQHI